MGVGPCWATAGDLQLGRGFPHVEMVCNNTCSSHRYGPSAHCQDIQESQSCLTRPVTIGRSAQLSRKPGTLNSELCGCAQLQFLGSSFISC